MSLAAEYDRLLSTPSDIWEHLPTFMALVHDLNAQHVIELGTRSGVSTIAWLYGLSQTRGGLTSVDLDEAPQVDAHGVSWEFIRGDDLDPAVTVQLSPADIVFIDTSHTYPQTVAELNLYRWLVKPGGRMVLHDTELAHPEDAPLRPIFPVKKAIEEFCADTGYSWTNHRNNNGLALIEGF